jgi:amidase
LFGIQFESIHINIMPAKKRKLQRPWQEIAEEAQYHRDTTIALVKPGLPQAFENIQFSEGLPNNSMNVPGRALHPKDFRITERLPEELVLSMAAGELSAVDVTTAFLRRAVLAQKLASLLRSL